MIILKGRCAFGDFFGGSGHCFFSYALFVKVKKKRE